MRIARRFGALAVLAGICGSIASAAQAQVITPPVSGGAIKAAKRNVDKTNEQTQAAEKEGASMQQKAQPPATKAPQKAAPPAQKAGAKAGSKAGMTRDTGTGAVAQSGGRRNQVQIYREQFAYADAGRRDPFVSLMLSGELRPVITDLTITGVVWDADPRKSLALLVDGSTGESYRVRVGQPLGRMRVTRIGREAITFSFDEFGLSRTETLMIDRTKKAGPAPARRP